jgi:hypothetical protein
MNPINQDDAQRVRVQVLEACVDRFTVVEFRLIEPLDNVDIS